jgi:hypothetical protein
MQHFEGMFILGIDDIGPKVDARRALTLLGRPHYRLETSPGNEQWGYRLEPPIPDLMDATNAQVRSWWTCSFRSSAAPTRGRKRSRATSGCPWAPTARSGWPRMRRAPMNAGAHPYAQLLDGKRS